jgi:hypothetical protein
VEFVWALVVVLVGAPVGVTAALQWGKGHTHALRVREAEISLKLAQQNDLNETNRQKELDDEIARSERQLALERAKLTIEADAELEAADKLEKAALKRLKAAEADIKAKAVAATLNDQIAADKELINARLKAALNALDEWIASQPEVKLPNPFEGINFERMFENFTDKQYRNEDELSTWDEFVGTSIERMAQAYVKAFAKLYKK